jgi:ankyrin repeat protein
MDALIQAVCSDADVIDSKDKLKRTALHMASWAGQVLVASIDVNLVCFARKRRNLSYIIQHALLLVCKLTAACGVTGHDQAAAVEYLLSVGATVKTEATDGITALHFACQKGHADVTKKLVDAGTFSSPRSFLRDFRQKDRRCIPIRFL